MPTITIQGSVFIVPSPYRTFGQLPRSTQVDVLRSLENVGLTPNGKLVRVWYSSAECDNWRSHRWKENPEFFGCWGLPDMLPESVLAGVDENDEIVLTFGDKELRLTAAQKGYRYRRFGTFEEVFEQVTAES